MDGLISRLLGSIDDTGREFVSTIYEQLGSNMHGIFRLMLIIYVIWWGLNVMGGRESVSPIEAAYRLGRAMLIFWFVTSWDTFSGSIYVLVQSIPEEVGKAVMSGVAAAGGGGGGPSDPTAIGQLFDNLYEQGKRIAEQVYTGSLMDIFGAILAIVVLLAVLIFTGIAVAAIVAAKIMLFIVVALAPIWIILALYRWSFRFWDGFITLTANLIIQQILIYGFLGFYGNLINRSLNMAVNGGSDITGKVAYVLPLILVTLIGIYVLHQITNLASVLSGGGLMQTTGAFGAAGHSSRFAGRAANVPVQGGVSFMRQSTRGRERLASDISRRKAARDLIAANARQNSAPLA